MTGYDLPKFNLFYKFAVNFNKLCNYKKFGPEKKEKGGPLDSDPP